MLREKTLRTVLSNALVAITCLGVSLVFAAGEEPSSAELKQQIDDLQRQVTDLTRAMKNKQMMEQQRQKQLSQKKGGQADSGKASEPSMIGNTEVTVGGYVKLDSNFSDYSDGSRATAGIGEDFLVGSTIPVGGESGDNKFHAHAKTSRLFVKTHTALENGHVNTHLEFDAIGSAQGDERISNSYSERVRHAYVDWQIDAHSALLAGQTWSTFFNVGALPELMDFVGPVGTIFERQPQLRYTRKTAVGSIQIAAENPATTLYNGTTNPYDDNSLPDLVARYNGAAGDFAYAASVMIRELRYEGDTSNDDTNGYALSLAGKYQLGRDDIRFMFNYGNALGRYMGLNSYRAGIIEADGKIELIDQFGGFVALRHIWNDQWRSNLVLSATRADNPDTVADTTPSDYESVHLNMLYSPVAKLTLGAEFIYASKTLENAGNTLADDEGDLKRLQFSVKYAF